MQTLRDSLSHPEPWEPREGLGSMEPLHPVYRELSFELGGSSSPLDSVEPQVREGHAPPGQHPLTPLNCPRSPAQDEPKKSKRSQW